MPVYEYIAKNPSKSCNYCQNNFERAQSVNDAPLTACPQCGAPLRKVIPRVAIGRSNSGLDDRAKAAGFKKLKKISKGEYEQQY